jgi:hypothetical protein
MQEPDSALRTRLRTRRERRCECRAEQRDDLSPPHEHLPRKRTLLSPAVKHERVCYAIGRTPEENARAATLLAIEDIELSHQD